MSQKETHEHNETTCTPRFIADKYNASGGYTIWHCVKCNNELVGMTQAKNKYMEAISNWKKLE